MLNITYFLKAIKTMRHVCYFAFFFFDNWIIWGGGFKSNVPVGNTKRCQLGYKILGIFVDLLLTLLD